MNRSVEQDRLAIIKIEGMHCHKCEAAVRNALSANSGVHEVEVDFPTGQASVLYERGSVTVRQLMASIDRAGYHAIGSAKSEN